MKRGELFKKIISIILIIVTILTQSELTYAAQNGTSNQKSTNFKEDQPKKRPIGKPVKTKKPVTLPYGILKNQDILEKWSGKKEDIAKRTENSKTYLNEDGSKTTLMFFEPIHVKADKNASEKAKYGKNNLKESDYLEINNNLKKIDNNGSYKNNFGLYDVYFPNTNESGIRIVKDESSINLIPEGLKWDEMEVADNQAFVPTETDGITYVYSVNNTSLKEDIVLDYQTNKQTYSYDLIVSNQFDVYVDNNILYVEGKNDKRIYYTMSTPYMEDREGNICENIEIDLQEQNGKYKLNIIPDKEWLNNTSRAYPVVIDLK